MIINDFMTLSMNDVEVPKDILIEILSYVPEPKMARVCSAFRVVSQNKTVCEFFWKKIKRVENLVPYNIQLTNGLLKANHQSKEIIQQHLKAQIKSLESIQTSLGDKNKKEWDAMREKLKQFCHLYKERIKEEPHFKFSSLSTQDYLPLDLNDDHISLDYCIDYMKKIEKFHVLYSICAKIDSNFPHIFVRDYFKGNYTNAIEDIQLSLVYRHHIKVYANKAISLLELRALTIAELKEYLRELN